MRGLLGALLAAEPEGCRKEGPMTVFLHTLLVKQLEELSSAVKASCRRGLGEVGSFSVIGGSLSIMALSPTPSTELKRHPRTDLAS